VQILISAGEASGEMYGAQLMGALRRIDASVEFFGVGGNRMRAAGCETIVDSRELSVVGITEILSHLSDIWSLFHKLMSESDRRKPDLCIVIDSPAFNWRVAREMNKRHVPVVYYVCPQFWAWRQGRVRLLRKYVDKALVIFPFEEKFYRERGVDAEFVGHPLADLAPPAISREQYAAEHGLEPSKSWIVLMPGSRVKEVRMNLPEMLRAAELLGTGYDFVIPVAPTLPKTLISNWIKTKAAALPIHLVPEALPALAHSRAGVVASGTATVEAALMGTPFVMVYRVTPLTHLLGRWMVRVPHFAMVNLIAGRQVVPELVQKAFTAESVSAEVRKLLADSPEREKMLDGLNEVTNQLRATSGQVHPLDQAAEATFRLMRERVSVH